MASPTQYRNINANGTTVVKSGAGTLARVAINSVSTGFNTVTLYDNTAGSGPVIATIRASSLADLTYLLDFATGLTVVSAGGAAPDITIVYG